MQHSATLTRTIQASPAAVYRAFSTTRGLLDWCASAADLDARPGGHLFLWTEDGYRALGALSELENDRLLTWNLLSPQGGGARVSLSPAGDGTKVGMEFTGESSLEEHIAFWDKALHNLKAVLETGLDRRVFDRPMLGILIGGLLDRETQADFNAPFPYGIIVSGTVDGMGAAAVGLQENDILVEMNGQALRDFHALEKAIAAFKAGDSISVAWSRDGEEHRGTMKLSGRPEPYVPETPAELADYVEGIYRRLDGELSELLDEVTEEQASFRRSEKEWSIKEILAHLIANERAAQLWVAAILEGGMLKAWPSNDHSLVKAVVDVYPTTSDLLAALRRTEDETIALVRRLPPEIVTHRGTYTNLATTLGKHGLPLHARMHFDTIRQILGQSD